MVLESVERTLTFDWAPGKAGAAKLNSSGLAPGEGGFGATGRAVVSEPFRSTRKSWPTNRGWTGGFLRSLAPRPAALALLKSGYGGLLIGGGDPGKLKSSAAEFGSRVATVRLDVEGARSVDEFCRACSIVVNCGGPVTLLQDRVAPAAFRRRCHYVDPAGMSIVQGAHAHSRPGNRGFGVTHRARCKMDSIESVSVYFSDSRDWSANALWDGVSYLRQVGLSRVVPSKPALIRFFAINSNRLQSGAIGLRRLRDADQGLPQPQRRGSAVSAARSSVR